MLLFLPFSQYIFAADSLSNIEHLQFDDVIIRTTDLSPIPVFNIPSSIEVIEGKWVELTLYTLYPIEKWNFTLNIKTYSEGSAKLNTDYKTYNNTFKINKDSQSFNIVIDTIDDDTSEEKEYFMLELSWDNIAFITDNSLSTAKYSYSIPVIIIDNDEKNTPIVTNGRSKGAIMKDIILKKRELENHSSKWKLYIQALDIYFEKYKDDVEKISTLVERVSTAKTKLWYRTREQEVRLLIEYIEYKGELIEGKIWQETNIAINETESYVAVFYNFVKYLNAFNGNAIKSISTQKFLTEIEKEWLDLNNINTFFEQQDVRNINWEIVSIQQSNNIVTLWVILSGTRTDWFFERENNTDYFSLIKIEDNWYLDSTQAK